MSLNGLSVSLILQEVNRQVAENVIFTGVYFLQFAVIDSKGIPDIPTLLIISDGTITDGWIDFEMDYASKLSDVTTVQLNCRHSVFDYEPDSCEKSMREFLDKAER